MTDRHESARSYLRELVEEVVEMAIWSASTLKNAASRLWMDATMASESEVTLRTKPMTTLVPSETVNVTELWELAVPSDAHDTAITWEQPTEDVSILHTDSTQQTHVAWAGVFGWGPDRCADREDR
eukprot:2178910-Rhodomonas_salina.3